MKLLVVDDSNIIRKAISKYLSKSDIDIVGCAEDGEKALKMCMELNPDVITLDITMPKMDGLTCLKKIMELNSNIKVLVISALTDTQTGLQALKLGAKGFLPKPFTEKQLQEEILELCG